MAQREWRGSPSGGAVGSGRPGPWNRLWDARVLGFLSSRGPDGAVPPTCPPKSLHLLGSVGFVAGFGIVVLAVILDRISKTALARIDESREI